MTPVTADLLITGLGELATLSVGPVPRRGGQMEELGRRLRAAVASDRGTITWIGPERAWRHQVRLRPKAARYDAGGGLAVPGFVDAHTHVLFAGSREGEIGRKVRGESYLDIAASGGGLFKTVRETRAASDSQIFRESLARLLALRAHGTTTVEVKSGYGLNWATERRLLRLVPRLMRASGLTLVPTFLGGHAVPPEASGHPERYLRDLIEHQVPAVAREGLARYCDVFCEAGFFTAAQSLRLLRAGQALGLGAKIHADEFTRSGGARVAAEVGAVSADHLLTTPPQDRRRMADAGVTAVLLPVTPFASLSGDRSLGREFVDGGVAVALGTDLSPNSWVDSMPLVLAHAVHGARLTPAEALTAATVNAAQAIGLGDAAGQISVGRRADLVVFDLPSVEHLPYQFGTAAPQAVFLGGERLREPPISALRSQPR